MLAFKMYGKMMKSAYFQHKPAYKSIGCFTDLDC